MQEKLTIIKYRLVENLQDLIDSNKNKNNLIFKCSFCSGQKMHQS